MRKAGKIVSILTFMSWNFLIFIQIPFVPALYSYGSGAHGIAALAVIIFFPLYAVGASLIYSLIALLLIRSERIRHNEVLLGAAGVVIGTAAGTVAVIGFANHMQDHVSMPTIISFAFSGLSLMILGPKV